jgi:hypothetical protein
VLGCIVLVSVGFTVSVMIFGLTGAMVGSTTVLVWSLLLVVERQETNRKRVNIDNNSTMRNDNLPICCPIWDKDTAFPLILNSYHYPVKWMPLDPIPIVINADLLSP